MGFLAIIYRSFLKYILLFSFLSITLQATANEQKTHTVKELYLAHQDMASDKWANYFDIYDTNFRKFVGKNPDVLEIGIQNGGSLQILAKFFKNAKMYGVDIDPKVCEQKLGENIKTYCFDIKKMGEFQNKFSGTLFDVIIDDGSHMPNDIIFAFEYLFEKVKPGGIYLVEDLHTSYWKGFNGGLRKSSTAVEYFKQLVDYTNYYSFEDNEKKSISREIVEKYAQWIEYITFYDSVVVIKKSELRKVKPYGRIVVGTKQPVAPTIDAAKAQGYYIEHTPSKE